MKFQAGNAKPVPMVRQDSKAKKFKKVGCHLAALPVKARCTSISALKNLLPRPSTKSFLAWLTISLLGLLAVLHSGSSLSDGYFLSRVSILGVKVTYFIGRQWRYQLGIYKPNYTYVGLIPPYVPDSTECLVSELLSTSISGSAPGSIQSSTKQLDFDFCLVVVIGDDGDRPNNDALPYPLVSRLTDALQEEVSAGGPTGSSELQVLVGVDFGSVLCPMVRDSFEDLPVVSVKCISFSQLDLGTKCGKLVTGESNRFVSQMPDEWKGVLHWESRRVVDLDCVDPSHQPPAIPEEEWQPTIVTGFSSNHLTVGLLLLRSIGKAAKDGGRNVSIVIWAMEVFKPEYYRHLHCVIDELIHEYGVEAEVRLFDWSAYPSWMRINQNLGYFGGTGEYAWKAIMVHTVLRERGLVIWADAGDRFRDTESLIETLQTLKSTGFVSRTSHGTVFTRTHPRTLKYFRANLPGIWDLDNCEAAVIGFTLKKYIEVARPWFDCSTTRQCIAPDGSDRSNHRQDQAALTLISILSKSPCDGAHANFSDHADDDPTLLDISGTYLTKCYVDPLMLDDQGTLKPVHRPHGIIN